MDLFTELKRRKVFRVAVVYAATSFAVLQGADILLPNLGVPDWTMRFLVVVFQAFLKGQSLFNQAHASEPGASLWDANEESERAMALAEKIDAEDPWSQQQLLIVYNETGDVARASALTKRIDGLAAGPTMLGRTTVISHNMLLFDLADAPNFAARLAEAGIDPARFRPMPRFSAGTEEE